MLRLLFAMALGRAAGRVSRWLGRGGSALPGLVGEKVDPRAIEKLAGQIPGGVLIVTGTNGKTTTTKMLVAILEASGRTVLTNPTGSNLARGVATRLIETASWRGRVTADLAVFEVDEAAVRTVAPRLRPVLTVVTNLARDQLDRFGELATTQAHVAEALRHSEAAVLNADDPMVFDLAGAAGRTHFYGAAPEIRAAMPSDSSLYGGSVDSDPGVKPAVRLERAEPDGDGRRVEFAVGGARVVARLQVPGNYNGYNAAAALVAAGVLGIAAGDAVPALERLRPAFGRGQVIEYRGRRIRLLLIKNPAGFNQAIRLLAEAPPGAPVLVAINDLDADGRDVSWLWDARVEDLAGTGHDFGTTGIRAYDMALRLKYAGVETWSEPDFTAALDRLAGSIPEGGTGYVVPTYTAMLRLLELLLPGTHRREAWT